MIASLQWNAILGDLHGGSPGSNNITNASVFGSIVTIITSPPQKSCASMNRMCNADKSSANHRASATADVLTSDTSFFWSAEDILYVIFNNASISLSTSEQWL